MTTYKTLPTNFVNYGAGASVHTSQWNATMAAPGSLFQQTWAPGGFPPTTPALTHVLPAHANLLFLLPSLQGNPPRHPPATATTTTNTAPTTPGTANGISLPKNPYPAAYKTKMARLPHNYNGGSTII